MTKTVVIWDDSGIKFFVADGDLSHLDQKYIKSTDSTDEECDEINELVYDEAGNTKLKMLEKFPVDAVIAGAKVVVIGFLP